MKIQPIHTAYEAYQEMILQIAMDYGSLPDVRTLTFDQVEFFYDGIRRGLEARTKAK